MPQPTATKLNTYTITISIRVSSGTYIRTLAHDIGAKLGCGAYLEELCRTSIGDFKLKDAISIIIRQSRANDSGNLTNEINNNTKKISNHYNNKISTLYSPCLKNSHIHNNIITPNNWTEYLIPIKTVVVSGTFDGIHNGHRNYFKQARKIGNKLIAIVARDTSVKKIKFHFPKFTEKERIKFVKQCKEIDSVLLGSKENQTEFAIAQNPDIIALGYDQKSFIKDLKIKTKKLNIKIIRLKPYKPKIYKSSIINNKKTSAGIYSSAQ